MTNKTAYAILFIFSVLTLITLAPSKEACANNNASEIAEQTCDTAVWNAMSARARMETQREIMQNQNLIFKADSILSYVCFARLAGHASSSVGNIFSNQGGNMDGSMNAVVTNSMNTYITSNFNHSLLGGRGQHLNMDAGPPQVQLTSTYGCEVMNNVWNRAKCMNFMHVEQFVETDGFYPFLDLAAVGGGEGIGGYQSRGNIREYPAPCGANDGGNDPVFAAGTGGNGASGGWEEVYRYSRAETVGGGLGSASGLYDFQENVNTTYAAVHELTRAAGGDDNAECGDAIPTGVQVMISPSTPNSDLYPDGICTNPGCSYVRNGTDLGTCTTNPPVLGGQGGGQQQGGQQTP